MEQLIKLIIITLLSLCSILPSQQLGQERFLKVSTYFEASELQYDTTIRDFAAEWNVQHSVFKDEVQLVEDSTYQLYSSPYDAVKNAIGLVKSGGHVIIAVSNCQSSVALKSWSDTHNIPLVLMPTELCNQVAETRNTELIDQSESSIQKAINLGTTLSMQSAINELHFPAFDLAIMLGFTRIVLIMDDFHYSRLYIESNAINSTFRRQSSFFVYRMDEVNDFFDKDANNAGQDNFIILGSLKSCQRFFSKGNKHSPILKIKFTWIISCTGLTVENFNLLRSSMAKMYLVTSQQDLSTNVLERLKASLQNITRTIAMSFEEMNTRFPTPIPVDFSVYNGSWKTIPEYSKWAAGVELIQNMRDHLKKEDHSNHAHRNIFNVYYRNIEHKNWTKLGTWNRQGGLDSSILSHYKSTLWDPNRVLRVVTVIEPPFVSQESDRLQYQEIGSEGVKYYGYCIDLLSEIMRHLGLRYEVYSASAYGSLIDDNWNGAVGEVVYGRADMAVSGMIITSARQDVVDFSSRYMDYSVGILIKKQFQTDDGFGFLNPLTQNVWVSFCALIFAVGLLMYALTRISPSAENVNDLSGFTDLSKFNMRNSIWFMISSIMMQGVDIQPATPSGRIIGGFWWFFSLTVTAMYTANLAAFLTVNRMETPIDSLQSLAYQNKISYGTVINSPIHLDFKEQAEMIPLYERIYAALVNDYKPSDNLVTTAEEGFEKVKSGRYAFMWDDAILQWIQTIHCEYISVGKPFMNKGYGIAMTKGSGLKKNVSSAILMLQEDGRLEKLRQKWFLNATECVTGTKDTDQASEEDTSTRGIDLSSVKGIFFTLMFGVFLSVFTVCGEMWMVRSCNIQPNRETIEDESLPDPAQARLNDDSFPFFNTNRHPVENGVWKKSIQYTEVPNEGTSNLYNGIYATPFSPKMNVTVTQNNHYQLQPFYNLGNSSLPNGSFQPNRWNYGQIFGSLDLINDQTTMPLRPNAMQRRLIESQNSVDHNGYQINSATSNGVHRHHSVAKTKENVSAISTAEPKLIFYNR